MIINLVGNYSKKSVNEIKLEIKVLRKAGEKKEFCGSYRLRDGHCKKSLNCEDDGSVCVFVYEEVDGSGYSYVAMNENFMRALEIICEPTVSFVRNNKMDAAKLKNLAGENIGILRRRKGLRLSDFARMAGCDLSTVTIVEEGKRFPSARLLARYADVLDVNVWELFYEGDENGKEKGNLIYKKEKTDKERLLRLVGENLKYYRKKRNLRQVDLAKKVGCSSSVFSAYETGKGYMSSKLMVAISDVLGVSPWRFFYNGKKGREYIEL